MMTSWFGSGARKTKGNGALEGSEASQGTMKMQEPDAGKENVAPDGTVDSFSSAEDEEMQKRMRSARERARRMIQDTARREAEDKARREAAVAAYAKEQIDLFLMAHGYGGINSKRTRMLKGKYPLHTAVKHRDSEMITLLLRAGADPSVLDSKGQTPWQLAVTLQEERILNAFTLE